MPRDPTDPMGQEEALGSRSCSIRTAGPPSLLRQFFKPVTHHWGCDKQYFLSKSVDCS